ncbi:unnamed protein product, partial [Polarella glacialis]
AARRAAANNSVLAAALGDAAAGSLAGLGTAPLAAVEESVLRMLVLQKELTGFEDSSQSSVLADAAAGLAPRMLQVLEAARSVCEANRAKLLTYCEDRRLDVDRSDYLRPQLNAIDKLHRQYASLLTPGSRGAHSGHTAGLDQLSQHLRSSPRDQQHLQQPSRTVAGMYGGGFGSPRPQPMAQHVPQQSPRLMDSHVGEVCFGGSLDPGGSGPQLPILRSGSGSTPPRAKFRQQLHPPDSAALFGLPQSFPPSELSTARGDLSHRGHFAGATRGTSPSRAAVVPAIPHWDRRADAQMASAATGDFSTEAWDTVAVAVTEKAHIAGHAHMMWDTVATAVPAHALGPQTSARGMGRSPRNAPASVMASHRSSGPAGVVQAPLKSAMQQLRGVTDGLANNQQRAAARRGGGGPHAGAGSPSPEPRPRQDVDRSAKAPGVPPEDKYLKILQSLQAKGAVNGLAAQLLEGARMPRAASASRRMASKQAMDSDSDSSSDDSAVLRRGRRPAGR